MYQRTALALLACLAGCVVDPVPPPAPPCQVNEDCSAGQSCRENMCFGGISGVTFAAELTAPTGRSDLARVEIKDLPVSPAGDVQVMFEKSIEVRGRVILRSGDPLSVAARVVFRRPSRIPGAPAYEVTAIAKAGFHEGEAAFTVRLPPTVGSEVYEIRIQPDDGTLQQLPGETPPIELAPPTRFESPVSEVRNSVNVTLDAGGLTALQGSVFDALGTGMTGMKVWAEARNSASGPFEVISSTGITDDQGHFEIYLPPLEASLFDLHVAPGPGVKAASLVRKNVRVTDSVASDSFQPLAPVTYPAVPGLVRVRLPVTGPDAKGKNVNATGAKAVFSTIVASGSVDTVTYETQATVDNGGYAEVDLYPGSALANRIYKVSVIPAANAPYGARWDFPVDIGPTSGGVLQEKLIALPRRVEVTGRVIDGDGAPAPFVSVRPQLAKSFESTLTDEVRDRIDAVGLPQVTGDAKGQFTLYLDATLAGLSPIYDLELVPPNGSHSVPRWSRDNVMLSSNEPTLNLGDVEVPHAALAMGIVKDVTGTPVPDAEVRVYTREGETLSRLRTLARSDETGKVLLVLPSP